MIGIDTMTIHTGWKICTGLTVTETSSKKKKVVFGASAPRPDNCIWVKKYFTAFGYLAEEIENAFKEGRLAQGAIIPAIYANERPYKQKKELTVVHDDGKIGKETISYTQFSYDIVNISLPVVENPQNSSAAKSDLPKENSQQNSDSNVLMGMDALMDFMGE